MDFNMIRKTNFEYPLFSLYNKNCILKISTKSNIFYIKYMYVIGIKSYITFYKCDYV